MLAWPLSTQEVRCCFAIPLHRLTIVFWQAVMAISHTRDPAKYIPHGSPALAALRTQILFYFFSFPFSDSVRFFASGPVRYGFASLTSSFATLVAPAGPENGPVPLPANSTMLVL